ncbi:hypothetical protein AB0B66_09805 [Catellatospora sp. NPDC049111]|uniref:hypothetical protein n=1 Tax=Catellatospora sp. NPDC049111 TaxID=3155271 RepID=UPI0033F293C9
MTSLSRELWRCYSHPASAAGSMGVNTEGWRREKRREGFADVLTWIRSPHLPDDNGMLLMSYDPVEELSHRVGRALLALKDAALADAITAEVSIELNAVERAELGDLTGRAAQAVLLTRADASPVQVMAADAILAQDPLGGNDLFVDVDPTAAAVAAAHWLRAAAEVTAEAAGYEFTRVVEESDNISALPHRTPTAVLELMAGGLSPHDSVTGLIREAMLVAEGLAPDIDELKDKIVELETLVDRYGAEDEGPGSELLTVRLTPLDPMRPARDMLEDLLSGIEGCLALYREAYYSADTAGAGTARADDDEDEDPDEDGTDDVDEEIDDIFRAEVQARAAEDHERLL